MANMLYRATKYTNTKDAMIARGKLKKRERQDDPVKTEEERLLE